MSAKMPDLLLKLFGYWIIFPALLFFAISARLWRKLKYGLIGNERPKLVWAGVPLYSLVAASNAMKSAGYNSISIANDRYATTNSEDFDYVTKPVTRLPYGLNTLRTTIFATALFVKMMFTRDILHGFFNGAILGRTPLVEVEYFLWKLAGGKLVLMPYGSDSFVYSKLPHTPWATALRNTYPHDSSTDLAIEKRLARFTSLADCVIGCIVHDICLPRVDKYCVLWYPADLTTEVVLPRPAPVLRLAHASNHNNLKGTDVLVQAVEELAQEGVKISLETASGVPREKVMEIFKNADVVVDQLLFGYALTALEAMAMGKPVVSGISNDKIYDVFRQHSHLDAAPIIPANITNIKQTLRDLVHNKKNLKEMGKASRQYVEAYHSPDSTQKLFEGIYDEFTH